jgi:hypothetical protein
MINLIPYFAALITILFSCGFAFAVYQGNNKTKKKP